MARWTETLAPSRAKVVTYHDDFVYLLNALWARPGRRDRGPAWHPGDSAHLANLIRMKKDKVKVVMVEPWADYMLVDRVAQDGGAVGADARPRRWAAIKEAARIARGRLRRADASPTGEVGAARSPISSRCIWTPSSCAWSSPASTPTWASTCIAREVVFVDIALAQIAALGATAAFLFGYELGDTGVVCARGSAVTILGALRARAHAKPRAPVLARSDDRRGLCGVRGRHGASGRPRRTAPSTCAACSWATSSAVRVPEVPKVAVLYAGVGAFSLAVPPAVLPHLDRSRTGPTERAGGSASDSVFYASFGLGRDQLRPHRRECCSCSPT